MPDELEGEFVLKEKKEAENEPSPTTPSEASAVKNLQKIHFLSSLAKYPADVIFENQEEDEEIILLVRRDLITNVPWLIAALVLIFIPPLISIFSYLFTPFFNFSADTLLVAELFYYLIIIGYIIIQYTLWYFNVGLVTNKRVVDLDLPGILFKHVSETKLNIIEDVSYNQVGSIRSVFDYGDVYVQTAGTEENFMFDRAPEPALVTRIIADLIGGPR
ncbi:MAG TPA: hypothetical protein VHE53_03100 [Patescibacteria group bacterium]|nr:hypothetical protein [Patescibacteria group bacterium]